MTRAIRAGQAIFLCFWLSFGPAFADGRWMENRPMEDSRFNMGAAVLNEEIYVAGGAGLLGPRSTFELFDPISDFWIPLPSLPGGREQFGMAAADGKIYVSGGFAEDAPGQPSRDVWIYDSEMRSWGLGPNMPASRAGHVMVAVDDVLYVIGGRGGDPAAVLKFDISTGKWSRASFRFNNPRSGSSAVVMGRQVYVIGGSVAGGKVSSRVDRVNVGSGQTSQMASLPQPRVGLAVGVLDGLIHAAGGATFQPSRTFFDHFVYDPSANRWTQSVPLPAPRFAPASATVGGRWYVMGGGAGAGFFAPFTAADVVESYAP